MNLDRVIQIIHDLKEEPTMSAGASGFSASSAAAGPVAGYSAPIDFRTRRGKVIKAQPIARQEAKKNVRKR